MGELAVTAIGKDQPGIVAAVAEVLRDHGGNVEDSAMTILRGHFAMMLLVEVDESPEGLREALASSTAQLGLTVAVTPVAPGVAAADPTHVLSVYGADRPGILAGVSRTLADLGVNITDLSTRMLPPEDEPVYAMALEISLPEDMGEEQVEAELTSVGDDLNVDHTLRALEAETL